MRETELGWDFGEMCVFPFVDRLGDAEMLRSGLEAEGILIEERDDDVLAPVLGVLAFEPF